MSFSQGKINFLVNAIMEFAMLTGRRSMLWLNIVPIEEIMGLIQLPHIPIEKLILANLITTPACAELIRNSTMLRAQFNCLVGGCQSTWSLVQWCELFNTAQLNWLVLLVLGWYNELLLDSLGGSFNNAPSSRWLVILVPGTCYSRTMSCLILPNWLDGTT